MGITIPENERRPAQVATLFCPHNGGIRALAASQLQKPDLPRNKNLYRLARKNDSVMHQHCGLKLILELTSPRNVPDHALDSVENVWEVPTGD